MPMIVSVPKETFPGEQRVALVPELVPKLTKTSLEVFVQYGAGESAGFFNPCFAYFVACLANSSGVNLPALT